MFVHQSPITVDIYAICPVHGQCYDSSCLVDCVLDGTVVEVVVYMFIYWFCYTLHGAPRFPQWTVPSNYQPVVVE